MAGKKAKFALADFFSNLFSNFGRIVLTNLIFAVPLAVFPAGLQAKPEQGAEKRLKVGICACI